MQGGGHGPAAQKFGLGADRRYIPGLLSYDYMACNFVLMAKATLCVLHLIRRATRLRKFHENSADSEYA